MLCSVGGDVTQERDPVDASDAGAVADDDDVGAGVDVDELPVVAVGVVGAPGFVDPPQGELP